MLHTRCFFYISKEKKKKIYRSFISVLICFTMSLAVYVTEKRLYPLVMNLAVSNASDVVTLIANDDVLNIIKEQNITYSDFVNINRSESGEIVSLETNTVAVNNLKSTLTNNIQRNILAIDYTDVGVHIGDLTDNLLLRGRGPKIPIRITSVSDVAVEYHDEFISAGINQTKHKLGMEIILKVSVALPNKTEPVTVKTDVPVAETVIVGEVPQVFVSK